MARLGRVGARRATALVLWVIVTVLAAFGVAAATTVSPSGAAPKPGAQPRSITLTFAGQVVSDEGLGAFLDPYPPIEGGVARTFTVPAGQRLVLESAYASLFERWTAATFPRSGATASVSTWYDLGAECFYPGYQRDYAIELGAAVEQTSEGVTERRRAGALAGPIYVEGGRTINGNAFSPHGDSELFVHIVVHGYLEPASDNPEAPVCGQP